MRRSPTARDLAAYLRACASSSKAAAIALDRLLPLELAEGASAEGRAVVLVEA